MPRPFPAFTIQIPGEFPYIFPLTVFSVPGLLLFRFIGFYSSGEFVLFLVAMEGACLFFVWCRVCLFAWFSDGFYMHWLFFWPSLYGGSSFCVHCYCYQYAFAFAQLKKPWRSSVSKKNLRTSLVILQRTALLDPSTKMISSNGRPQSWVQKIALTRRGCSSWKLYSQGTTLSNLLRYLQFPLISPLHLH